MNLILAAAPDLENISIANAAIVALLGYAVVFFGLILLMTVLIIMGKAFTAKDKKAAEAAAAAKANLATGAAASTPVAAPAPGTSEPAPGTAGQLKLYDTNPKTAAMIMAIVADKMGKPLNELRFISIKEVK